MAACARSGSEESGPAGENPRPASAAAEAPPAAGPEWGRGSCAHPRLICREVRGFPTMLLRAEGETKSTVLLDAGGPGISLENTLQGVLDSGLPANRNILLIGETWEVSRPPASCLKRESRRLANLGDRTSQACHIGDYRFSAGVYRRAIEDVTQAKGYELVAALGVSFGATRVAIGTASDVPLVLVTPAPIPSRSSVRQIASTRSMEILAESRRLCKGNAHCKREITDIRSGELTEQNVNKALALLGSASSPSGFRQVVAELRSADRDSLDWRRRAYAATYRYGSGSVLPNFIGYRSGTCSVYPNRGAAVSNSIARIYQRVLACPKGLAESFDVSRSRTGCLFEARDDLVTPPVLTRTWLAEGRRIRLSASKVPRHGTLSADVLKLVSGKPEAIANCGVRS